MYHIRVSVWTPVFGTNRALMGLFRGAEQGLVGCFGLCLSQDLYRLE